MISGDRNLSSAPFTVGRFTVHPDTNSIRTGGNDDLRLEPLVMDVLVTLARAAPTTVSRDELLEKHWPEHVTEDVLNRVIWKLRKALEGCHDGETIETVPKRGYRLAAPVEALAADVSQIGTWRRGLIFSTGFAVFILGLLWLNWPGGSNEPAAPSNIVASQAVFRPVTSLAGYESSPSFSPEGSKLVFSHYAKTGERKGQIDVYELDLDSGQTRALTETSENEFSPVWSPDGGSIAFARVGDDSCALVVLSLSDLSERLFGSCSAKFRCCPELDWSPDGTHLAVSDQRTATGPARLLTINVASGEAHIVTDPPAQGNGDRTPRYSHEGTIAFVRSSAPGLDDIWLRSLADSNERRLTFEHQPLAGIDFTDDGREIVFSSRRTGVFRLYRTPLSGGPIVSIDTVGINATSPALRNGTLVYEEWRSEINVWKVPLDDDTPAAPFIQSSLWDWNPSWSPSGDRVAFLSNRTGPTEAWIADAEGTRPRKLTDLQASFSSALRWSANGRRIAFAAPIAGNFDIIVVDVDTGTSERLTSDASDERDPTWAAAGDALYFSSNRTSRDEIWRLELADGALTQITTRGGHEPRVSPDGSRLFFTRQGDPTILTRDLLTGREEIAVKRPSARDAPWELLDEGVAWIEPNSDNQHGLWHQIPGGDRELMRALEGPDSAIDEIFVESTFSFSPDARHVLVGAIDRSDSDLWSGRW